jgi:DNA-binding ferritin-like protein
MFDLDEMAERCFLRLNKKAVQKASELVRLDTVVEETIKQFSFEIPTNKQTDADDDNFG